LAGERILVVDDEPAILELVSEALKRQGFRLDTASDGDTALEKAETTLPDLILLDLMLPKLDGWEVCRRLKNQASTKRIPILMLTARRDEREVIAGLEIGADDYMKKPFSLGELVARVKALLRRSAPEQALEKGVQVGPLKIDFVREEAFLSGNLLSLSPTEYRLLEILARHPGRMVSRDELLAKVWGYVVGDTRTVDVHVFRLRRKIEADPEIPKLLHTVRGRGFRLDWEENHEDPAR
jgi:two-component system phosphate regulon response regulator PhoB/two-component system alkaline phosphatase synthesis response regulator PhoP